MMPSKPLDLTRVVIEPDGTVWEDGTPVMSVDGLGHIQKRHAIATLKRILKLAQHHGAKGVEHE